MLDLENREVLIQYLLEKGVIHSDIPYEVNYCRGGVSCIAALIETEGKTMLAEKGASPKYVQYRLGHKNIQVTMQIYQHLTDKMSEEGDRLLDLL